METNFSLYRDIISFSVLVAGSAMILLSKVKTDNLNDLKERVEILEKEREEARRQHIDNQKAIANLEGQLATYKEIPLKSIAKSLDELSKSNGKILDRLEKSAALAQRNKNDGGLLVKTKKTNPLDVEVKE